MRLKEEIEKRKKKKKKQPQMEKKKCSFTKIMHRINQNDGKTTWNALRIASALTLISRSGP